MEFYLITTDHMAERLWFLDDEDFKAGMNYVALVSSLLGIKILSFILMSNHVHFVVSSSEEEAMAFINAFKKRYSSYYNKKYSVTNAFRRVGVDIRRLDMSDESLERGIAYVQVNSVAANICLTADSYPWGTGNTFFNLSPIKGVPLSSISGRKCMKVLHTHEQAPGDLILTEEGFIHPRSYVMVKFVESLFRSPKRMNYFLMNSSKIRGRNLLSEKAMPSFRDQVLLPVISDMCRSMFHKKTLSELDRDSLVELVKEIRRRLGADVKQISRVSGIPAAEVSRMIEGF